MVVISSETSPICYAWESFGLIAFRVDLRGLEEYEMEAHLISRKFCRVTNRIAAVAAVHDIFTDES